MTNHGRRAVKQELLCHVEGLQDARRQPSAPDVCAWIVVGGWSQRGIVIVPCARMGG
ncbi:Hypothetical protein GbCGDNIH2_5071 [Granulibacter bethesdensis]|uniref:Uncharacterized protein n=2 Tax=Granulibacter bethesdensis TaxID=364410 RepID=A0A286M332_GRABC|nr:Hypothetical protein GbCGDNIH3_5071 [Granulibacter bethesdensis]AHJ66035.1 Hypothetical protein GbCGDNIH4_5071 [Granulibacter bethesdensis CGDNIH4]ASV62431.1 Hypothetical protein GbCGDNIH1_5071 [Granulibacter bethesdensis CGDNIH1]AHJ68682.1 Hypothetical protein GbCGDNIH2_5071 [Granulibacter bethesdensis]APH52222.1 Hypothetical protein GbCGDNIH5_5071 [Granulibacter bethesdensis]